MTDTCLPHHSHTVTRLLVYQRQPARQPSNPVLQCSQYEPGMREPTDHAPSMMIEE